LSQDKTTNQTGKYNVKYLGGYPPFWKETSGKLCLYGAPDYKVTFESSEFVLEIGFDQIHQSRVIMEGSVGLLGNQQMLAVDFQDAAGYLRSPLFRFAAEHKWETRYAEEFHRKLYYQKIQFNQTKSPSQSAQNPHPPPPPPNLLTNPVATAPYPAYPTPMYQGNFVALCPKCNSRLLPNGKFCSSCGTDVSQLLANPQAKEKVMLVCPKCQTHATAGTNYCPNCGEYLGIRI
jgi:hypothetical protein